MTHKTGPRKRKVTTATFDVNTALVGLTASERLIVLLTSLSDLVKELIKVVEKYEPCPTCPKGKRRK